MLQYVITTSTKVKMKDSFVRVQNERMIVGARFKTNQGAEKVRITTDDILKTHCSFHWT